MTLLSYDPWNALTRLQEQLEGALDAPFGVGLSGRGAFPPVNVFRGQDGYVARFEVPGLAPQDLSIEANGRNLLVSGKRAAAVEPSAGGVHRRECWRGEFSRSLQFPEDADVASASAECKHGVLTVRVPQRPEARPRRISVTAS
jgi:HSP20 family protein